MRIRWFMVFATILVANGFAQTTISWLSPAEQRITFIKKEIERNPAKSNLYSELAIALIQRARETSDRTLYDQAEAAVQKSLSLSANNLEARKAEIAVFLGTRRSAKARIAAENLNHEIPDDVIVYGYVADAEIDLGEYEEAEKATQWMLDLRPNNIPGLISGAHLRQVFGDLDGAIEFLNDAYQQTLPDQVGDLALILTEMAGIDLAMGKAELAEQLSGKALKSFPDYYLALERMAQVRTAQGKYSEAAELWRRRNERFPEPSSIYRLAEALERAGRMEEAKPLYSDFEQKARRESSGSENVNLDLVFFYLNHHHDPAEALRVARLEIDRSHNVFTLDAYASALCANGDYAEARKQIEKAMATGVRDASILFHAATISFKLNDQQAARHYLEKSLELNPVSEVSSAVRDTLAKSSTGTNLKQ